MLRVGLTGGIGSGKSAVARRLTQRGAVLVDADRLAREVVAPGTPGLDAVVAEFGAQVRAADGGLDRERMASVVFADPGARRRLEAIVHPLVRRRAAEQAAAAPPDAVVVHDVPLLVETGQQAAYHLVVVVDTPADVRVERLERLRGMAPEAARRRIASQAGDDERRAAADVLLANTRTLDELDAAVDRLWDERLAPYEDNLRSRRPVRPPNVQLVAPDPGWPMAYERLSARLARVTGTRALRIDHVGSTAVPGLAAQDVVDVQLTVASMADADALAEALADAGLPRLDHLTGDRVTADRPTPADPDPARWVERVHIAADPGRRAHVHLRARGSAGWRNALLFRDWLRAEPAERAAYEERKRTLAVAYPRTDAYTVAKEPWFDAALPRAERWAAGSGWVPPAASRTVSGSG